MARNRILLFVAAIALAFSSSNAGAQRIPIDTNPDPDEQRDIFTIQIENDVFNRIGRSDRDYTNGFRFYSPRAVEVLLRHGQRHKGYIYLSESLTYLLAAGMTTAAFPIRFRNRERGVSNTSLGEIRSALTGIFEIAARYRFAR